MLGAVMDDAIAKAAGVAAPARIARTETTLQRFMSDDWRLRSRRAAANAAAIAVRGTGSFGDSAEALVVDAIDAEMKPWATDIEPRMRSDIASVYAIGRRHGVDRAKEVGHVAKAPSQAELVASFDTVDRQALGALENQQLFWIGGFYEKGVSTTIADHVRDCAVRLGRDRRAVGRELQATVAAQLSHVKMPAGFAGNADTYFRGLAGNAVTVARADGQLQSFARLGITHYVIGNPIDEKTCPVCGHMDGKSFSVADGLQTMTGALTAATPEGVRVAHPWLGAKAMLALSPSRGGRGEPGLTKAGFNFPPFHFHCRCFIDIHEESMTRPLRAPRKPPALPGLPTPPAAVLAPAPIPAPPPPIAPAVPLAPTKPVFADKEARELASALKEIKARGQYPSDKAAEKKKIRDLARGLLEEIGLSSRDVTENRTLRDNFAVKRMLRGGYGIRGYHTGNGQIVLDAGVSKDAQQFLDLWSRKKFDPANADHVKAANGFRTMMHETIHGAGPFGDKAYQKSGAATEEVATEVLARVFMRDKFGLPLNTKTGSYQTIIDTMCNVLSSELFVTDKTQAFEMIAEASKAMRQAGVARTETYGAHVWAFVDNMTFPKDLDDVFVDGLTAEESADKIRAAKIRIKDAIIEAFKGHQV